MASLRVAVTTGIYPPDVGGTATYAAILMEELPRHGVEPSLLNFRSLAGWPRGVRHVLFLRRILTLREKPDVLLSLDPVSVGVPTLLASRILRTPMVLRVGGDYAWEQGVQRFGVEDDLDSFLDKRYGWRVEGLRALERWVAGGAARVIVPARYLCMVLQRWGLPADRITVIHNTHGVTGESGSREEAKARLGWTGRWVVSIGRLLRLKGYGSLIDVVGDLQREMPDLHLAIVGSGPEHQRLEEKAARHRSVGRIRLAGSVPHIDVLTYLRAADVFVLNSAAEGMSHAILEAMAVGTPVVATRVGGNPEFIEDGLSGRLVTPGRPEELREALRDVLLRPARAAALAVQARQSVGRLDRESMVRQTASVLHAAR